MKYQIEVMVKAVHGSQIWEIDADSKEEAVDKYYEGLGKFVAEELEVTGLESLDLDMVTKVDNAE